MAFLDKPTPAGEFKHLVTFNPRIVTCVDEMGNEIIAPDQDPGQSGVNKWAAIIPLNSEERVNAAENIGVRKTKLSVRFSHYWNPTEHDSLLFNNRTLNIVSIVNAEEANAEWHILAEEVDDEQGDWRVS